MNNKIALGFLVLFTTLVLVPASGCVKDPVTVNVVAGYRMMMEPGEVDLAPDCAGVSALTVSDAREESTVIGEIFEEEDPANKADVLFSGDAVEWVGEGARTVFAEAALDRDDAGGPTVELSIEQIDLTAEMYWNAEFDGTVILGIVVKNAETGDTCWTGSKKGFAENYGSHENLDNFKDTLNHALDRAVVTLVRDRKFLEALCECRS